MDETTLTALRLTLQYAFVSTALVLVPGVALAYVLARFDFWGKSVVSALTTLPMVMPPTAVGYLLLRMFASDGPLGPRVLGFDLDIVLTGRGVVIACAIMAMPLIVRTARVTFEGIDPRYEAMGRTLGYGRLAAVLRITLPLASRGLLAGAVLGFARAMGEFGATITVAGNIPGKTQTLASAIFSAQQAGNEREAYFLLAVALAAGFCAIIAAEWLARSRPGFLIAR
jgi:molybdate transport system permease protein